MASTDRALLKDVLITVESGDATPIELDVCFTNLGHTCNKTYADVTSSCDDGKVYIPSDILEDTFTFTFFWEGENNDAHMRMLTLSRATTLGVFTITLPDGLESDFDAYVKMDLFTNGQYDAGMQASVELKCTDWDGVFE